MTVSVSRPSTRNSYSKTSSTTGTATVASTRKLLSPALARHSSWPEMETGYKRNWQFEMAEQHRRNSQVIDRSHPIALQRSHTFDVNHYLAEEDNDDTYSQWTASSPTSDSEMPSQSAWDDYQDAVSYERGAFSPVFEDESPALVSSGHDNSSSPVGPTTPFGDFIDRAVAVTDGFTDYSGSAVIESQNPSADYAAYTQNVYQAKDEVVYESPAAQQQEAPAPPPSASAEYKKMAAPMSIFMAEYVWKACTTGMSLPTVYSPVTNSGRYSAKPPSDLAPAIHNMLLSTLLQPSAIVLAMWYIVRLPICFESIGLGPEHVREFNFRTELLGRGEEYMQGSAPFRLVILGCMLANKWLDDHTFSNMTWQSISYLPVASLNKLESLSLDIFSYDLSTSTSQWSQWLGHLVAYHQSIYYPVVTDIVPISRPSGQDFVRKMFDEVWCSTIELSRCKSHPQPVFLGVEQRKKDNAAQQQFKMSKQQHAMEIDLDEDGPLREEYVPRRRTSTASRDLPYSRPASDYNVDTSVDYTLPPPAEWIPAADERIYRRDPYKRVMYPLQPFIAPATTQWYPDWTGQGAYMTAAKPSYSAYVHDNYAQVSDVDLLAMFKQTEPRYEARQRRSYRDTADAYCDANACHRTMNKRITSNENNGLHYNGSISSWSSEQYGSQQVNRIPFGAPPQINYASSWLRARCSKVPA